MPLLLAFTVGLVVALLGVWAAAYRAGRVRPIESLREATVQYQGMSRMRWALGLTLLGTGGVALGWVAVIQPRMVLVSNIYINILLFTVAGVILLSPVVVPLLVRLFMLPFHRLRGATALLVQANTLGTLKRTAAVIAPIALTLGFILSSLGVVDTVNQAKVTELTNSLKAPFVLIPEQGNVIGQAALQKIQERSGTAIATVVPVSMYVTDEDGRVDEKDVEAVDSSLIAQTLAIPLSSGSLDMRDDTIVVSESWDANVGDKVSVRLKDGRSVVLRVAGVFPVGINNTEGYVSSKFAGTREVSQAYAVPRPGADIQAVESSVRQAVSDQAVRVVPRDISTAMANTHNVQASWVGLLVTLGITIIYSTIAVSNTIIMATANRLRDLLTLQRIGATRRQLRRVVIVEAVLVVAVSVVVAVLASLLNLIGVQLALSELVGATPLVIPWIPFGLVIIGSLVVAIMASIVPVYLAFLKDNKQKIERRE
jgi:putative ABC transport system permease protein